PSGGPPDPTLDGQLLKISVSLPLSSQDTSYNPASGARLRGGQNQEPAIVRLANPTTGTVAPGVNVSVKRQMVIFEQDTVPCAVPNTNNGPLQDLLNNTRWKGLRDGTTTRVPGSQPDKMGQGIFMTELPRVGATEL